MSQKSFISKSLQFVFSTIFIVSILSGCGLAPEIIIVEQPATLATVQPLGNTPPQPTSGPAQPAGLPDCLDSLAYKENGQVVSITDGDTIRVTINGQEYRLRYIGIDTPEVQGEDEYLGSEATSFNEDLVEGKTVLLFRDRSNSDRYDRLLRYVVADGVFVNLELVRQGYAYAKDYPPDTACSQAFHQAEDLARREKLGLWSKP